MKTTTRIEIPTGISFFLFITSRLFTVRYFFAIMLAFINVSLFGQCLIPLPEPDGTWPVTNRNNTEGSSYIPGTTLVGAGIYNMVAANGTYYLTGSFLSLVQNQGQALVIDSATSIVKTQPQSMTSTNCQNKFPCTPIQPPTRS